MNNNLFKILLIGDSGVGKSSLLNRFSDNVFDANHLATIGIDFRFKNISIDKENISIEMWDTTGHKRFRDILYSFYKKTDCILLIFDLSSIDSFQNINTFFNEIEKFAPKKSIKILVGNKLDLERKISLERVQDYIKKLDIDIKYIEISAKDNINIDTLTYIFCKELLNNKQIQNKILLNKKKSICNNCF